MNTAKKRRIGTTWIVLGSLVLLAGLGAGGYHAYRKIQAPRLANRAKELIAKKDYTGAALYLRQAIKLAPDDAASTALIAEIAELNGDPSALSWRVQQVHLDPQSLDAALACARTAVRFEQPAVAESVLAKVAAKGKGRAEFHAISGQAAAALGKNDASIASYTEALRLDPKNQEYRFEDAAVRLNRGWLEDQATARATLEELRAVPSFSLKATRVLLNNALINSETARALRYARTLANEKEATYGDRLVLLDLLHRTEDPGFAAYLDKLKADSLDDPEHITAVAVWMNQHDMAAQTIAWSDQFPPTAWATPPVCGTVGFASLAVADWNRLSAITASGNWGPLEYLRLAFRARVLRGAGNDQDFRQTWGSASIAAAALPHGTVELAKLAGQWGWKDEAESLIEDSLEDTVFGLWAARNAFPQVAARKDTATLLRVTRRLHEADPKNDAVSNNFAMFSLLLGKDVNGAATLAKELYGRHPKEPDYVSTYAYALHLQGLKGDAIKVMKTLGPDALQNSGAALYYAIFLAASGAPETAQPYFAKVDTTKLLPEEVALLDRARGSAADASLAPASAGEADYIRFANQARTLREKGDFTGSLEKWNAAYKAAASAQSGLPALAHAVADWGWNREFDEVLHGAIKDPKEGAWACRTLWPHALAQKDASLLLEISSRLLQLEPQNDENATQFIRFALLLEKDELHASQLIPALYAKHPQDPATAACYAYSLQFHKRSAEALKVLNNLAPAAPSQEPWIALYNATTLAAAGELDRARPLLDSVTPAKAALCAEESTLLRHTQEKLSETAAAKVN